MSKNEPIFESLIKNLSIDFAFLANLPCHVYCKNREGVYLGYNDYGANNFGYANGCEIVGKTDFEIFPQPIANLYRRNDTQTIFTRKQIFIPEEGILKENLHIIFLTYKIPIFDDKNEITGILGLSFTRLTDGSNESTLNSLTVFDLAQDLNHFPPRSNNHSILSKKERSCLEYLCQGLTQKQTAKRLSISPRTVETHLERAKAKLNCKNKTELILAFSKNLH